MVALDEAHAAHVCCQIEHVLASLANLLAVVKHAQINEMELITEDILLHAMSAAQ